MPKKLNASEEAWYMYAKIKKDNPHKENRELHKRYRWSQYADDVRSGKINVCKWVELAVERQFNDLKNLPKEGYSFDPIAAARVVGFFPDYLKHYKGGFNDKPFNLEPWQQFITACLFGWKNADGFRRFNKALIIVPRKNGKTTWVAGLGIYLFMEDNEAAAEVYIAATKHAQAKICHNDAKEMIKRSPDLNNRVTILRDNLHIIETASKFEPLAADSKTLDGLNVSTAIVDEVHAHADRKLWEVLETGIGSRDQPIMIGITTAGTNRESICYELKNYTEKLLELPDEFKDESFFGIVYTIDEGDNWEDEPIWFKANPNLEVSCKLEDLRKKVVKARNMPAELSNFLRKHLDVWTESENPWLNMRLWRECNDEVDPEKLIGRECYAGLDLASVSDLTSLVLLFTPINENEKIQCLPFFWIPGDNIHERVHSHKVPYDVWVRQGYIEVTPGNAIDNDFIKHRIDELMKKYNIKEIGYDRHNAYDLMPKVNQEYTTNPKQPFCIEISQGWDMSPPTKELEIRILSQKIAHGNNPVLTWMASNVVVHTGPSGNYKPDKRKSKEKIDGIVAMIMALDRMIRYEDQTSVYATRGVISFT